MEKHLIFHRTNRCLGCVGYVYVGQIYQNRDEPFWGRVMFDLMISNVNIGFQKFLTLPLSIIFKTCFFFFFFVGVHYFDSPL